MSGLSLPSFVEGPLPGTPASLPLRRAALETLAKAGWPSRRTEAWKYTDLEPLAHRDFDLAPRAPSSAETAAALELARRVAPGSETWVFLDGHQVAEGTAPKGVETRCVEAPAPAADGGEQKAHPLAALNTAFAPYTFDVRVQAAERPATLHLVFVASARKRLAPQPRVLVELERGATLALVQHFVDTGGGDGWINAFLETRQAAESKLTLLRVQCHAEERTHTSLLRARLGADASIEAGYFDAGGALVRNDVEIELAEPGAAASLFGLFIAGASQHVDNHTTIDHAAGETVSEEIFRGIVGGRARGVFNGKVIVRPQSQRIEARQSSDNLLLSPRAEIDTKPELQIYADDVKCAHGATVGELDAEQLFYLRARGLDERSARELLTTAFADVVIARIADDALRDSVTAAVRARLARLAEAAP